MTRKDHPNSTQKKLMSVAMEMKAAREPLDGRGAIRAKRLQRIKEEYDRSGGNPDLHGLAKELQVGVATIRKLVAEIRHDDWQLRRQMGEEDLMRMESAVFFEDIRDWSLMMAKEGQARVKDGTLKRTTANERVGYARVALEAEAKRMQLLGLKAPEKKAVMTKQEIVVRYEDESSS